MSRERFRIPGSSETRRSVTFALASCVGAAGLYLWGSSIDSDAKNSEPPSAAHPDRSQPHCEEVKVRTLSRDDNFVELKANISFAGTYDRITTDIAYFLDSDETEHFATHHDKTIVVDFPDTPAKQTHEVEVVIAKPYGEDISLCKDTINIR